MAVSAVDMTPGWRRRLVLIDSCRRTFCASFVLMCRGSCSFRSDCIIVTLDILVCEVKGSFWRSSDANWRCMKVDLKNVLGDGSRFSPNSSFELSVDGDGRERRRGSLQFESGSVNSTQVTVGPGLSLI